MKLTFIEFGSQGTQKAREERSPNAWFEMFINSTKALSLDTSQFPGFRRCCGSDTHICGFGTHETLDALEKYEGADVESIEVFGVIQDGEE